MQNSIDIALSGLTAQQRSMDVVANNVANANTSGFKAERVLFSDWLSRMSGAGRVPGDRVLDYTQDRATYREIQAGPLSQTGNPLDVAIAGDGYFQVQTANGVRLTRAGRFTLGADGTITDTDGHALLDDAGRPMQVSGGDSGITVAGDGTVETRGGPVGKIGLVTPNGDYSLKAEGNSLFAATGGTSRVKSGRVVQGALEGSNVQPVLEMTRMMNELRDFQFVTSFVQAEGDRMQSAIDKITKRS